MDGKKGPNLVLMLAALCVLVVLAAGYRTLHGYRQQLAANAGMMETQQKTIEELTAERDALKNRPPEVITQTYAPPPETEPQSEVQQVFEPLGEADDYQSKIDALKKRYEEVLVSYFVLRHCELAPATDYHIITSAMSQEMASLNAPGRLQFDILTSAQGSYKELYSGNKCLPETTDALRSSYRVFVDTVSEQFTP